MIRKFLVFALPLLLLSACEQPPEPAATFTSDGKLLRPDPTGWVFVSSSAPAVAPTGGGGESMMSGGGDAMAEDGAAEEKPAVEGRIDIIHIDPESWEHFQQTGEFPNGTVFTMSFYSLHDKGMDIKSIRKAVDEKYSRMRH